MIKVFTSSGDAIVTTVTGAQHLEMIDCYYRIPQVGRVTVLADVGRADVIEAFTGRSHAVMAVAATLGSNILVIEIRWYPTVTAVTVITLCGGG